MQKMDTETDILGRLFLGQDVWQTRDVGDSAGQV